VESNTRREIHNRPAGDNSTVPMLSAEGINLNMMTRASPRMEVTRRRTTGHDDSVASRDDDDERCWCRAISLQVIDAD
jgi:hypothetical protein